MEKLYTVNKNKTRSRLWLRSWTPYCQIQTEIEVGKTTRPFRYDLYQIPYDYAVDLRNRFKGLDLIEYLKNYERRFVTLYRRQWSNHPQEKDMQKGKMVVWEGFTNSWEKKRSWKQRRNGKIYPLNAEFKRIARRDKKAILSDHCKEIEENNRMGKTQAVFKKIINTKGIFHAKMCTIKDRNYNGPNRRRGY